MLMFYRHPCVHCDECRAMQTIPRTGGLADVRRFLASKAWILVVGRDLCPRCASPSNGGQDG